MRFSCRKLVCVILCSAAIYTFTIPQIPYSQFIHVVNNTIAKRFFIEEPCACVESCLAAKNDSWFKERFRNDVPSLLSLNNSEMTDEIFNWWQSLQKKSTTDYKEVIKNLFAVIPGGGRYEDAGPSRCRTCAVVGNSGNLLKSHYGPLIDSNDFVIRMNKAPIEGYEDDVGFRTTHRVMYPESAFHLDNVTHLVLLPFKTLDIQWVTSALSTGTIKRTRFKVIDRLQGDKNKAMVMHPAFMYYVHKSWMRMKGRRSYPSTGFLALMLALHVCDEVNVFGFGANSKGTWHHYFEVSPKRFRGTGQHSGKTETVIIKELQNRNIITLYKGW